MSVTDQSIAMVGALGWSYVGGQFLDGLGNVRSLQELITSVQQVDDMVNAIAEGSRAPVFDDGTYDVLGVNTPGLTATYTALPLLATLTQHIVWDMAIQFRRQVGTGTQHILSVVNGGVTKFLLERTVAGGLSFSGVGIPTTTTSNGIEDGIWYRLQLNWNGSANVRVSVNARPLRPVDKDRMIVNASYNTPAPIALTVNNDLVLLGKNANQFEGELLWVMAHNGVRPREELFKGWQYAPAAPLLFDVRPGLTLGVPLRDHVTGGDPMIDGVYYLAPTNNPYR